MDGMDPRVIPYMIFSHSPGLNRAEAQSQCSYIGYNPNLTR